MASIDGPQNYALFTIPAYLLLAMIPHAYSISLLRLPTQPNTHNSKARRKPALSKHVADDGKIYEMTLPRAPQSSATYAAVLPPHIYERYERARAAHSNMLENAAFVVAGVLGGIVTRVDAGTMNVLCGAYLASRLLYGLSYVTDAVGGKREWAWMRTVWFVVGNGILMGMWWKAGVRVLENKY